MTSEPNIRPAVFAPGSVREEGEESRASSDSARVTALRTRRLPGEFLYASAAQARRWLAYHQACSPSRADPTVETLYREAFASTARSLGASADFAEEAFTVVGLGAGGGRKDAELVEALLAEFARAEGPPAGRKSTPRYIPVDAAEALVLEAAGHVGTRHREVVVHPLVMNLARAKSWAALPQWLDSLDGNTSPAPPRIVSCLGLLPNFDRHDLLRRLRTLLRGGPNQDRLLLSANLSPVGFAADRARIISQYDNPPARTWYGGALEELGLRPENFRLEVTAQPLEDLPEDEGWIIEVTAEITRDTVVRLGGEDIPLEAGERLAVFFSQRFTTGAVANLLNAAGLMVREQWSGANGEEGVFLCAANEEG